MTEEQASYETYTAEQKKFFRDMLHIGGMVEKWAVREIERLERENENLEYWKDFYMQRSVEFYAKARELERHVKAHDPSGV